MLRITNCSKFLIIDFPTYLTYGNIRCINLRRHSYVRFIEFFLSFFLLLNFHFISKISTFKPDECSLFSWFVAYDSCDIWDQFHWAENEKEVPYGEIFIVECEQPGLLNLDFDLNPFWWLYIFLVIRWETKF